MKFPIGQLQSTLLSALIAGRHNPVATQVGELGPPTKAFVSEHLKASWSPNSGAVQSTVRAGLVIDELPPASIATPMSIHASSNSEQVIAAQRKTPSVRGDHDAAASDATVHACWRDCSRVASLSKPLVGVHFNVNPLSHACFAMMRSPLEASA